MKNIREIDPPANAFTHRFAVAQDDIDLLGHAGNVSWIRWVNEATTAHSRAVGLDLRAYRQLGLLWVVRRHEIDYLAQAFEADSLEATTWVEAIRGATSLRRTQFHRCGDRSLLASARTTWVLIKIDSGRPTRVPEELIRRYGFETDS